MQDINPSTQEYLAMIYNADWSLGGLVREVHQKMTDPDHPECALCDLTYTGVRKKPLWRDFIRSIDIPVIFLYRNELAKKLPAAQQTPLPAIVHIKNNTIQKVLVAADEFSTLDTVSDLVEVLAGRIPSPANQ